MKNNKTYKCLDNDVVIKLSYNNTSGALDEVSIGVVGDSKCGSTVVSANDLTAALRKHITEILIDFQVELNIAGLIPNALWDFEKVAKGYTKNNLKYVGESGGGYIGEVLRS